MWTGAREGLGSWVMWGQVGGGQDMGSAQVKWKQHGTFGAAVGVLCF